MDRTPEIKRVRLRRSERAASADLPVPRNPFFEGVLYEAIRMRVRVLLRYADDTADRLFEPAVVYWSGKRTVLVSGTQIVNPQAVAERSVPHSFEVGKITRLHLTGAHFVPAPGFDRSDPKYKAGIICSL